MLTDKMTIQELERIRAVAYHCWGYQLTQGRAMDVWRLTRGLPVIAENDVPRHVMRNMAKFHIEVWPMVRGQA